MTRRLKTRRKRPPSCTNRKESAMSKFDQPDTSSLAAANGRPSVDAVQGLQAPRPSAVVAHTEPTLLVNSPALGTPSSAASTAIPLQGASGSVFGASPKADVVAAPFQSSMNRMRRLTSGSSQWSARLSPSRPMTVVRNCVR